MKRICLIVASLIVLLSSTVCADVIQDARAIADKVTFISDDPTTFTLDDKLILTFTAPAVMLQDRSFDLTYYSFKDSNRFTSAPSLNGVYCTIKNITDKVIIVKWSQSALTVGSFSGIPLLGGMPYTNAGNPSALPDTVLLPGQSVDKSVYVSRVEFNDGWWIIGEPIPKAGGLKCTLALQIVDSEGKTQYVSAQTPLIGVTQPNKVL